MKRVVLVGGGHAHAVALLDFARRPLPDCALTLISEASRTPYSGMLPGAMAGIYREPDIHIDLPALAQRAGATFIAARATGIDAAARELRLVDGNRVSYDMASLDVGITPDLGGIEGAAEHAAAVKPISRFLPRWSGIRASFWAGQGARITVVGGGPAGVELALAVRARLRADARAAGLEPGRIEVTLVSGGDLVANLNPGARARVEAALRQRQVRVVHGRAVQVDRRGVTLADGTAVAADAVLVATHAQPPRWLAASGLPVDEGHGVRVRPTLQVEGHDSLFAAGDCASFTAAPLDKAGVYAVRQGPILAGNIRALAAGGELSPFVPQRQYLMLLSTGDGRAIGARGPRFSFQGRAAFWLKHWIDRRFMAQFR